MSITKLQPFNLDSTANYTFANVTAGNITGSNLISANYVTGTLTTAEQPNITSTGTLSNLSVSGNVALSGANVSLGAIGNVKITGGTANYVLQTDGTGNLSWAAQTGGGGSGTSISNGTSNVNIATSNGDVTTSVNGNANVLVVTGTGANVNGYANITGNVALSGANVSLGAIGNVKITGGTANYVLQTDGTGNLSWTAQTGGGGGGSYISNGTSNVNIPAADGNINFTAGGNANVVVVTGTGANVNGYASITGNVVLTGPNVSLGTVGNIKIAGGSNGQVLATDGTGNLTWKTAGSGPGGTGFLYIYTRTGGPVTVDVVSRYLNIVGRSGIIPIEIS